MIFVLPFNTDSSINLYLFLISFLADGSILACVDVLQITHAAISMVIITFLLEFQLEIKNHRPVEKKNKEMKFQESSEIDCN